ncbi:UbiA-like polyprenyltransferase [Haliscomenobacter hydrossis]|uniref:4-hydroxybenzoate polyprenyltransferase n=1 Tax=Haliscomenobacter hydrossis (strain ATCC 27775 / DSM 1100 / LMG 10767 / O) TaxID=760192 RepID=F4KQ19_HALH1|nr:UbiA-like polyprenyltransferase [Haliscomenobacter hydrossis]AEE53223.1 4-hydroxybenzoate polyprenyltransferase [Haliscomenobacter hydrossis DSM 1100]
MQSYFSLIKFSHTIFAMPFALLGFTLGTLQSGAGFNWKTLGLVVLCMVFARSAAMAFNRYLDRDIDERNPRTKIREIPAGVISPNAALIFVVTNALLFMATAWFINPLCFYLSPVALLVVLGYSYTKRFTYLCHFVLGLGLALAPIGAYLATGGGFDLIPLGYSFAVLFWVAGFDIIYALQDEEFDREQQLNSIPVVLGRGGALRLSEILHLLSAAMILLACWQQGLQFPHFNWIHWVAAAVFLSMLFYQHTLVKPNDLSKVNLAFFTTNGVASLIFGTLVIVDVLF